MANVLRYTSDWQQRWDDFVAAAKNATFLHRRAYMDYHADRFRDHSLVVCDAQGRIIALLPACAEGDALVSHAGLTYGGLLTPVKGFNAVTALEVFDAIRRYCADNGFKRLIYKAIPYIYHKQPADEDVYALFRGGAVLTAVNCSSVIDLSDPVGFDATNRRNVRIARDRGVEVRLSQDYAQYWQILTALLSERYDARPVHSLAEMRMLAERFPDNIRLYAAHRGDEMLGGIVLYVSDTCAHAQYIATTARGRADRALSLIVSTLVDEYTPRCRYLCLGTSNGDGGRYLNESLLDQKSRFGARAVAYPTYTLTWNR